MTFLYFLRKPKFDRNELYQFIRKPNSMSFSLRINTAHALIPDIYSFRYEDHRSFHHQLSSE